MNPLALLALAAAGFAAFSLSGKSTAASLLQYDIKSLKVEKLSLTALRMRVVFGIINPTDSPLAFTSFVGDLMDGTTKVTSISTIQGNSGIQVAPNGTTLIPIVFNVPNKTIITKLLSLFTKGDKIQNYTIKGLLKLGSMQIPVNQTVSLTE